LKNGHPNQLFDQVILGYHSMKSNQQKDYINQVVQSFDEQFIDYTSAFKHYLPKSD